MSVGTVSAVLLDVSTALKGFMVPKVYVCEYVKGEESRRWRSTGSTTIVSLKSIQSQQDAVQPGTTVRHRSHGKGYVMSLNSKSAQGKPVEVCFGGIKHKYSLSQFRDKFEVLEVAPIRSGAAVRALASEHASHELGSVSAVNYALPSPITVVFANEEHTYTPDQFARTFEVLPSEGALRSMPVELVSTYTIEIETADLPHTAGHVSLAIQLSDSTGNRSEEVLLAEMDDLSEQGHHYFKRGSVDIFTRQMRTLSDLDMINLHITVDSERHSCTYLHTFACVRVRTQRCAHSCAQPYVHVHTGAGSRTVWL